ncbi:hypothetical protein [Mangrovicoccus ximenensis]|uniref:hypothetical protein n=1 Tax=Mangrovicoccus ximenensis TaxID=1911570 RepID=UPI000D3A307F|nr:hypothetical protein [Mangrovicoccus ximenensis]
MFTIEHEFDATVVTLVDEGHKHLQEDVIVSALDDCVTIAQYDPVRRQENLITLSMEQISDLRAALDLPEGMYRVVEKKV